MQFVQSFVLNKMLFVFYGNDFDSVFRDLAYDGHK